MYRPLPSLSLSTMYLEESEKLVTNKNMMTLLTKQHNFKFIMIPYQQKEMILPAFKTA